MCCAWPGHKRSIKNKAAKRRLCFGRLIVMGKFSFSDRSYIRGFENALDDISVEVRPPNFMAVLSDQTLTRKPYWVWLKRSANNQLKNDPGSIVAFFDLKSTPAPDVFAWYCCLFHSYRFLAGSSSCYCDDGSLSQWGEYIQSFLSGLISYGIDERFIEKQPAIELLAALLHPELSQNILLVDKHVPSSYSNRKKSSHNETALGCGILSIFLLIFLFVSFTSD